MSAHVVWAIPNYGAIWAPAYQTHMAAIAKASRLMTVTHMGSVAGVGATDRMALDVAENVLCEQFLTIEKATHIFMTELDMLLPEDTIERLLAVDKDIVSGIYFLREGHGQPCLYKKMLGAPENPYAKTPLTIFPLTEPWQLNGCPGVGCVLIKREVFAKMEKPWWHIDPGHHGSDMYFYTRAVDAGCEVWVEPRVRCGQIEYVNWSFDHYWARLQHDPEFPKHGGIISHAGIAREEA